MAFEMKNFKVFKKVVLPKSQLQKECEIELDGDVSSILTGTSQVALLSSAVADGMITYSGEISGCVVYATEDGRIGNSNIVCEFSGKIEASQINEGDKVIVSLSIKDSEVSFENGKAVLNVTIEESAEVFAQVEVSNIDCTDDDICLRKGKLLIERYIGENGRESETQEEIASRGNVKKIVLLEPTVNIKSSECENGCVTVSGDTITRLIYLTEDDKFESTFVISAFKEEVELEGCEQGMSAICKPYASIKNTIAEVLESDKGTKISVKTPFALNVHVFGEQEIDVIEDMYSTLNEIQIASESFDMTKICKSETLESKIDGSLSLSEDKPRVDKIIFNGGNNINVTNAYVSNKELFVEGVAKTTVVYLNDDEGSLNSVEIEIPFVLSDKTDASDNALVCADATIYDSDVSVKRGRELFFDGKVKVNARICEDEVSATITKADRGEMFTEKDCAMQYVYGKAGEELWDIAKRNKVKEEQLILQNSDVTFPLIQDTGFILFFQKFM